MSVNQPSLSFPPAHSVHSRCGVRSMARVPSADASLCQLVTLVSVLKVPEAQNPVRMAHPPWLRAAPLAPTRRSGFCASPSQVTPGAPISQSIKQTLYLTQLSLIYCDDLIPSHSESSFKKTFCNKSHSETHYLGLTGIKFSFSYTAIMLIKC